MSDTEKPVATGLQILRKTLALLEKGDVDEAKRVLREVSELPPEATVSIHDFEMAFRTACRKHGDLSAAYIVFSSRPGGSLKTYTGGHSRAQLVLDQLVQCGMLYQRATQDVKGGVARSESRIIDPSIIVQGGKA